MRGYGLSAYLKAMFIQTRFFLQRAFIWIGWAMFAYLVGKSLIFGIENSHVSMTYVIAKAALFPLAGHALSWIVRVGLYD